MEFLHGEKSQVANTDLAAALGTVGIPRDSEQPLRVLEGEIKRIAFFFGERSPCGQYETASLIPMWDNPKLCQEQPRHAMTYMRTGLRNRSRLLDYYHAKARVGLAPRPGGQFEVINLQGPQGGFVGCKAPSSAIPDPSTTPRLQTDDLELAAALLACGIPLWRDFPVERASERLSFFFMPASPCGQFNTRELMLAWDDRGWHERHPDHPFAYLSCVFENRRRLMREIRRRMPMAVFIRGDLPQFLTVNADAKTESLFMRELKKLG